MVDTVSMTNYSSHPKIMHAGFKYWQVKKIVRCKGGGRNDTNIQTYTQTDRQTDRQTDDRIIFILIVKTHV